MLEKLSVGEIAVGKVVTGAIDVGEVVLENSLTQVISPPQLPQANSPINNFPNK